MFEQDLVLGISSDIIDSRSHYTYRGGRAGKVNPITCRYSAPQSNFRFIAMHASWAKILDWDDLFTFLGQGLHTQIFCSGTMTYFVKINCFSFSDFCSSPSLHCFQTFWAEVRGDPGSNTWVTIAVKFSWNVKFKFSFPCCLSVYVEVVISTEVEKKIKSPSSFLRVCAQSLQQWLLQNWWTGEQPPWHECPWSSSWRHEDTRTWGQMRWG